ncbi:MAG: hypothetical protein P8Z70_05550 [Desulfuromonadales bacterium]|jgi:hypothetical protein
MTSRNLENLAQTGQLKREPADQKEFDGLVSSARARLNDARNASLALESRFDLAYNASHALSLAALRWNGYRSDSRFVVFQCIPHTLGLGPEVWRVLAHCHNLRNRGEYEGLLEISEPLVEELVATTEKLLEKVDELGPVG